MVYFHLTDDLWKYNWSNYYIYFSRQFLFFSEWDIVLSCARYDTLWYFGIICVGCHFVFCSRICYCSLHICSIFRPFEVPILLIVIFEITYLVHKRRSVNFCAMYFDEGVRWEHVLFPYVTCCTFLTPDWLADQYAFYHRRLTLLISFYFFLQNSKNGLYKLHTTK